MKSSEANSNWTQRHKGAKVHKEQQGNWVSKGAGAAIAIGHKDTKAQRFTKSNRAIGLASEQEPQ